MAVRRVTSGALLSLALVLGVSLAAGPQPVAAAEPSGFEYFHTYAETETVINQLVATRPTIARKLSIGRSYEGREIWAIKLTGNIDAGNQGKPEVLINGLMHARERASSELAIYTMQVLANNYGLAGKLGRRVTDILDTTIVWIIPMMNPDGAEFDFTGGKFHKWRKNRQPNQGSPYVGTDLNRQFGFTWNCCGGSSGNPKSDNYRGPEAWSAPEVRAYRDFINGRVVNGKQRITEILSLHTAGRQVLWPYAYTKVDVPSSMTADDHATFVNLGKQMAKRNGYRPEQASDLYIVDGDQDDWAYNAHRIFALTIEMAPGSPKRYYPSQSQLNKDLARNRGALLWFLEQAGCPYRVAGLATRHCGIAQSPPQAPATYDESVYQASVVKPQTTSCWCVVAAARAWVRHIDGRVTASQADLNGYMTPRDKNDWTDPSNPYYLRCTRGSPSPSFAHDGRGMAWTMWRYATPDGSRGFNDYLAPGQAAMNWQMVRNVRATGQPVGVIVAGGQHAILVVGYNTAADPFGVSVSDNKLLGIRVWDSWYGAGFGSFGGWQTGGFAGNSYVAVGDWNSTYFRPDTHEGPYYRDNYVAILPTSTAAQPSDTPPISFGQAAYLALLGDQQQPPDPPQLQGVTSMTISSAIDAGLRTHDLLGDPELGNLPATYTIGDAIEVDSLDGSAPYLLVELRVGELVRAVALVHVTGRGYSFGELRATTGDFRLPQPTELGAQLAAHGLSGVPQLVWGLDG